MNLIDIHCENDMINSCLYYCIGKNSFCSGFISKATITLCDLSAAILFKFVDSYLIFFKFTQ